MSSGDNLAQGSTLLSYKLVSKLSDGVTGAVWRADQPDKDRRVTIKILGGDIKFDKVAVATRVKDLQFVTHGGLAPIYEVAQVAALAIVVREFLDGQALARMLDGKALDRNKFFHIGVQIANALAFLHSKRKVHGNLRADNVIVDPRSGRLKLTGLGLVKLPNAKIQAGPQRFGHLTVREVSYMSPEQLTEKELTAASDVFSFGCVLYEMATGRPPFDGSTSLDVINKILNEQPPNPMTLNPALNKAILGIIGKCLHKDPAKRYMTAEKALEDMKREAGMAGIVDLDVTGLRGPGSLQGARRATVLAVDVASHPQLMQENPEKAARVASVMQQLVSEAVYLYDGKIADQFATTVLAEFGSVNAALEAAKKARADLEEHNQGQGADGDPVDARMLIHVGDIGDKENAIVGPAVDLAKGGLSWLAPMQIALSEAAMIDGKLKMEAKPSVVFSGMKFYEEKAEAPKPQGPPQKPVVEEIAPEEAAKAVKKTWLVPAIAGGILLIVGAIAAVMILKKKEPAQPFPAAQTAPAAPTAPVGPKRVAVDFVVETADPALTQRANAVRLSMIELLKMTGNLEVVDAAAGPEMRVGAKIRDGAAGPELVPMFGAAPAISEGTAFALSDVGVAITNSIAWLASQIKPPSPKALTVPPAAVGHYVDALHAAQQPEGEARAQAITSIQAAITADPSFLPAQLLALELFEAGSDRMNAIAAASKILELDPRRADVARKLAQWQFESGNPAAGIVATRVVLANNPSDEAALATIGRYALGVNNVDLFNRVVARLRRTGYDELHETDVLYTTGKIDAAANKYYEMVSSDPHNASLSFKTGRVSILRRAVSLAELELKKLETLDPAYRYHLLKAYIAAEARDRASAEAELKIAEGAAPPGATFYTDTAEVYAVLGDPAMLVENLKKAVQHGEPTQTLILSHPLFRFLEDEDDGSYQELKTTVQAQRAAVAESLAGFSV